MSDATSAARVDARENFLLGALPNADYRAILADLELIEVEAKQTMYNPEGRITHVYFPVSSVFSLLVAQRGEVTKVEVATIGREGMLGLPAFLGGSKSSLVVVCQIAGLTSRLPVVRFESLLTEVRSLEERLRRFTDTMLLQLARNLACNRLHDTEQRASKWLLMTDDRVGRNGFALTQEFLGQMLGVGRPTASLTASALQQAGLIRYSRGVITVTDRDGLETQACGCYRLMRDAFDRLRLGR